MKTRIKTLCLMSLIILSILFTFSTNIFAATGGISNWQADTNTMESYQTQLLGGGEDGSSKNEWGSRYAGRVWSDKSVVAYDPDKGSASVNLNLENDGILTDGLESTTVSTENDFLHVFSTLGSSLTSSEAIPQLI